MKKKFQDAEKEAGGDEKLIFKFAWPYIANCQTAICRKWCPQYQFCLLSSSISCYQFRLNLMVCTRLVLAIIAMQFQIV